MGLGKIWGFIRDGPSIKFTSSLIKNIKCTVFSSYNITELNIFHYVFLTSFVTFFSPCPHSIDVPRRYL